MPETSQPSEQATVIDSDRKLARTWYRCQDCIERAVHCKCENPDVPRHVERMAAEIAAAREAYAAARDTPYQQGRREHRFMQERDAAIAESARWAAQFESTNAAGVQLAEKLAAAEARVAALTEAVEVARGAIYEHSILCLECNVLVDWRIHGKRKHEGRPHPLLAQIDAALRLARGGA